MNTAADVHNTVMFTINPSSVIAEIINILKTMTIICTTNGKETIMITGIMCTIIKVTDMMKAGITTKNIKNLLKLLY